ncbi:hypothetical protein V8E54_009599 [Elaphomyces granulatus]
MRKIYTNCVLNVIVSPQLAPSTHMAGFSYSAIHILFTPVYMPARWRSEPECFKRGYWRLESFTLVKSRYSGDIHSTSEPAPFDIAEDGPPKYYNHCWDRILMAYTNCALTKPDEDKSLALEGILQHMERYFNGSDYVSGFFCHELPLALLWWLPDGGGMNKRPNLVYRAASWRLELGQH